MWNQAFDALGPTVPGGPGVLDFSVGVSLGCRGRDCWVLQKGHGLSIWNSPGDTMISVDYV